MKIKWHAHLPGIAANDSELPLGKQKPIDQGYLTKLRFDEWFKLDGAFPYSSLKYEKSQPIFYVGEAEAPNNVETMFSQVTKLVNRIHKAFLLSHICPLLPPPAMSATYITIENEDENVNPVIRLIGPAEREWIVYGSLPINCWLDESNVSEARSNLEILRTFNPDESFYGVEAGLQVLTLTSLPEFWWSQRELNRVNDFIHCMAALENILVPRKDEAPPKMIITRTFGRNLALILVPTREDVERATKFYSILYRLRCKLIHGEIGIKDLNNNEYDLLGLGRKLLGGVLVRTMRMKRTMAKGKSLPNLLALAYADPQVYESLFNLDRRYPS